MRWRPSPARSTIGRRAEVRTCLPTRPTDELGPDRSDREPQMPFGNFEHVPAYPLAFPLFYGAAVVFALVMARHLRVFAAAGPSAPVGGIPERLWGVIEYALIQTKMFKDPRAALMHWGIFWGFVLLTIGTANVVTGGLVQAVLSWPFGGALWTIVSALQNLVAVIVLVSIAYALFRRFVSRPARLTYSTDALIILG